MAILKPEITGKHSETSEKRKKKQQPAESQKHIKTEI